MVEERFGLKKRTLDVCLAPKSGRKWVREFMSESDPERTHRFIALKAKHGMEDWRGIGDNCHILWIVDSPSVPA